MLKDTDSKILIAGGMLLAAATLALAKFLNRETRETFNVRVNGLLVPVTHVIRKDSGVKSHSYYCTVDDIDVRVENFDNSAEALNVLSDILYR